MADVGSLFEVIDSTNPNSEPKPSIKDGDTADSSPKSKKGRKRTSACWSSNWFRDLDKNTFSDGRRRAECTKCGVVLLADTAKNGTSSLTKHMKCCPKRDNKDVSQMFLSASDGKMIVRDRHIDPTVVRDMVMTLVVRNELPLRFVEYEDFRKLILYLWPQYKPISRNTQMSDIHKIWNSEKEKVKELMTSSPGRISLTTDLWTSITNDGYITLTAHYIDRSWVLQKRMLRFTVLSPPHSGAHICEAIWKMLNDWGIDKKLFSVTVDNASSNDSFVSFLRNRLNKNNSLVCKGEFFHVRCCAHVLNLIVQDGINLIDESVQKVRDSVKFVKSSQTRKSRFMESCKQIGIPHNKGLHSDVTTRWNSTYHMLEGAIYYRTAFENLAELEPSYKTCPSDDEWMTLQKITKFLKPFDEITNLLSGTKYPTSNLYFPSVLKIQMAMQEEILNDGSFMKKSVDAMKAKFDKYWDEYVLILSIAVVLDPRYKLAIVEWAYARIYGKIEVAEKVVSCLKTALYRIFEAYKCMPNIEDPSINVGEEEDAYMEDFSRFKKMKVVKGTGRSDIDHYLEEPPKPHTKDFNVLEYWKGCEQQYPNLARMARDILAIPVSTVASESAFSTGGRVIDKYRSKLLPKNVEALICLRDWMFNMQLGAELDADVEDLADTLSDILANATPTEISITPSAYETHV